MRPPIKVLFLAAEAEPFIKVGGLADVAGSLPHALRMVSKGVSNTSNLDIRLALPLHGLLKVDKKSLNRTTEFNIYRKGANVKTTVYEMTDKGLPIYLIDGEPISAASGVYSSNPMTDREKYTFFSLACLEMLRYLEWKPDILHSNDWHTALTLYSARSRNNLEFFTNIRTVLTVHNLPFMGGDATNELSAYGLTPLQNNLLPSWALTQPLPLGLWAADIIVPVSPTYAKEIMTPEYGCSLESYLAYRSKDITGILNGLDLHSFDPATDKKLASPFTIDNLERRSANKEFLQKKLGLPVISKVPLIGMVGRVDQQKGVDLAINAMVKLCDKPWQFVLLGSGDHAIESSLNQLKSTFPDRVHIALGYDADLGRQIYAGADIFLMPSRYEPCGLAQMIAMHYGCVPVVRATGGLKDTVVEGKTGFLFQDANPDSLLEVLSKAMEHYAVTNDWKLFQICGMQEDFSWDRSARSYASVYHSLVNN